MPGNQRIVLACLVGLAGWFVLFGFVNGTPTRKGGAAIPVLGVAVLVAYRPSWGAYAAMSIFAFWLWLLAVGIIGDIILRDPSALQRPMVFATPLVTGPLSMAGRLKSIPLGRPLSLWARCAVFVVFIVLQVVDAEIVMRWLL